MQNWKIKRMSYKRLGEWLEAIKFMLSHYEKNRQFISCPFCDIAERRSGEMHSCKRCLWGIIENKSCVDFKYELGYKTFIVNVRGRKRWRELRIPMLRRWKKILQAERDSRTEGG